MSFVSTPALTPRANTSARRAFGMAALSMALCAAPVARAQVANFSSSDAALSSALPAAPEPQQASGSTSTEEHTDGQSKRILGIIPNFRSVNADVHLPPQSVKEKFTTATEDSFDYSSIFIPLAVAGYDYARNTSPEFGTGGVGYGRYLWHSVVDQTVENYMVEFIVPVATHEDTRYYSLGRGGFLKRAGYSMSRVVITRSDSGGRTFNTSEVVGAGAAAGISTLYYPSRERSFSNTAGQWGTSVGIDALGFLVKEFSPDISHALLHSGKVFHLRGDKSN
jgi:hypothetical protein